MNAMHRHKRALRASLGALAVIVVVAAGVVGWHFSNVLRDGALLVTREVPPYDLEVVEVADGRVVLRTADPTDGDGFWTKDGIWGLEWADGYAQVGAIASLDRDTVVRTFQPVRGALAVGQTVRLHSFALSGDPLEALGLEFQEVTYPSELGDSPAWLIEGEGDTWAIFVHGRAAHRGEALRLLPTVVEMGYPSLVITYRNDEGAPGSPDGFYRFGAAEWRDVEAAVRFALDQGASEVVLVGYSMGGATVTNFLLDSPLADEVRAVVLDAPILSFDALIDHGAQLRGIAGPLVFLGKTIAGWRFGIDWKAQDYLRRADELDVPILLFHGDDDERVHPWTSEALAKARPDIVTYVPVPGATHVRAWNMDPAAYEARVREFLLRHAPPSAQRS